MSFLGSGNTLSFNANTANFGAGRVGPQVQNGPQVPSSYYHPGLNIAHGSFSSSSVYQFSLPLLPGHASLNQQIDGLSGGKGAQYTLPGGPMVAGHHFFSQAPTFVGPPQALSQLPTTPFPSTSSWNLPPDNVVNTPALGAPPHHVRVSGSLAGLSATSLVLPPASTRFHHLQNSPVTWVMLEDQRSDLGLAGIEAFGHPSSIGISSNLADPATIVFHESSASEGLQPDLYPCTTADSDVLNDETTSFVTDIPDNDFDASFENDNSVETSSSDTLAVNGFNTQTTSDISAAILPLGNPDTLNPATNSPYVLFPQSGLPYMIDTPASRGETKQIQNLCFDQGNDSGQETSSRGISVEPQQHHAEYSGQSGLADEWENQARNSTSVHIPSTYSELAHALTPVVQTPTPSPTSPSSSTSSSQPHTTFTPPPANHQPQSVRGPEATRIPHSQIVVPGTSNTIASHGETKRTKKTNFDHGNDFGLVTSSRGISVEPQQRHTEYSGPSALAVNDEWENQACNSNTSVHIPSTYSELAHALTLVVSTSTPNTTSPSSSTSSSQPHTTYTAPPTNVIPSETLLSTSAPATACQHDRPDGTLERGSVCSSRPPPQKEDAPRPPVYSATHPPSQTAAKKRKFDEMDGSMSSFPVTSALQAARDPQSLEASMAQSRDVDPKPKRGRGRPRKVDPPPQRKGFRPIVPREPIPPRMMTAQSPPIPSSSSGPSFRRAVRKEHKPAHGFKCPISAAESRQGLQEMTDLDYQARGFSPLRLIVLEPYEG